MEEDKSMQTLRSNRDSIQSGRTAFPKREPLGSLTRVIFCGLLTTVLSVAAPVSDTAPPSTPTSSGPLEIPATGQELIFRALENNADLKIDRLNVDRNAAGLLTQRAIFDPQLAINGSASQYVSIINQYDYSYNGPDPYGLRNDFVDNKEIRIELSERLPTGGRLSLVGSENYLDNTAYQQQDWQGNYVYPYQETYTTRAYVMLSHPFLRNAGVDATMAEIRISRLNTRIAGEQWKLSLSRTSASVYRKYLDLSTAQTSLRLTQETIANLRQLITPASPPEAVADIEAKIKPLSDRTASLQAAIDNLNRSLVHDLYRPPDWSQHIDRVRYIATLPPDTTEAPPQLDSTVLMHIVQTSPEYRIAVHNLSQQQLRLDKNSNQALPELEAYGRIGYIGFRGDLADSVEETSAIDNKEWEIGLRFTISVGDKRERGLRESAQTEVTAAEYRLEKLAYELQERFTGLLQNRQALYARYCDARKERESLDSNSLIGPTKPAKAATSPAETVRFWQVRLQELDALALCEKTRLDWEVATGELINRFGLVVEE